VRKRGLLSRRQRNRMARPRLVLLSMAVAAVALAAPASAAAQTQSAQSGPVSATFTFSGKFPDYKRLDLTIARAGVVVYDAAVTSKSCADQCSPAASEKNDSSVHVRDLDASGEPEVLLDLYTGGAHCCWVEQIFSFEQATGTYLKTEHNFGNPGFTIKDLKGDGQSEFITADNAFAYAFTDYAASGMPIQILRFAAGHLVNVTRSYPRLIRADARRYLRAFKHHLSDGVGLIAAWAADEYMLGHGRLVRRTLATEQREGNLRSALGSSVSTGRQFVRALNRFLRKHGYRR
jgi:hypothetical protein